MSRSDLDLRLAAAKAIADIGDQSPVILRELGRVLESSVFRGSRRSCEFLRYVVQTALDGRFEELKERVIGSALFHRPPDYDTSSDAIVRVVANETRKRLNQYYTDEGHGSAIRFELPSGSYIPTVHLEYPQLVEIRPDIGVADVNRIERPLKRRPLAWYVTAAVFVFCVVLLVQNLDLRQRIRAATAPPWPAMPWHALFSGNRGVQLVLADTSVGGIQVLQQTHLSLADYLNGRFISNPGALTREKASFMEFLLGNQYTSASYASVAARIAQIAQAHSSQITISFARGMSLRTIKGGDNIIVLGSARANPWVLLLEEQLNFVTGYGGQDRPCFRNRSPRPGEPAVYSPLNRQGETSQEYYGHIAFLPFLYHEAHVLLISGTTSEGTEGAGEFAADPMRLKTALRGMGIDPEGAPRPFELLLKVNTTTRTPVHSEVIASRESNAPR